MAVCGNQVSGPSQMSIGSCETPGLIPGRCEPRPSARRREILSDLWQARRVIYGRPNLFVTRLSGFGRGRWVGAARVCGAPRAPGARPNPQERPRPAVSAETSKLMRLQQRQELEEGNRGWYTVPAVQPHRQGDQLSPRREWNTWSEAHDGCRILIAGVEQARAS
jgi:hypothetical protein